MSSSSPDLKTCKVCKQEFGSSTAYNMHLTDEENCKTKERVEELEEAGLSENQAWSWALSEEGYSAKGISQIINKPKNTVETHLQRAREKKKDAKKLLKTLKKPRKNTPKSKDYEREQK